jgi:hypothetical protein
MPSTDKNRRLYSFNWEGGGYNQVFATSMEDALNEVDIKFGQDGEPHPRWNRDNVRGLSLVEDEAKFWAGYPRFD